MLSQHSVARISSIRLIEETLEVDPKGGKSSSTIMMPTHQLYDATDIREDKLSIHRTGNKIPFSRRRVGAQTRPILCQLDDNSNS